MYRGITGVSVVAVFALMGAGVKAQEHAGTKGTLRHEGLIDAPVEEVWKAFTTAEGLKSWMAPLAEIELRVGGKMLASYKADGKLGDENTIENTILSFEPQRMLSIKATKPPAGFPFPAAIKDMWSVIYFEPVGADRTRVTVVGMGYGDSEEHAKLREFFDKGNAHTIEQLRKKFAKAGGASQADPFKVLQQLVGGEWTFENKRDDGSVFRGRTVLQYGPDEKCIVGRGWLGDAKGMWDHGATQVWRDPHLGAVRFQNIDEQGSLASGEIVAIGENAVSWDWNMVVPGGRRGHYRADMFFSDADHYEFVLHEIKADGTSPERVRVKYTRVERAGEAFHQMKSKKQ